MSEPAKLGGPSGADIATFKVTDQAGIVVLSAVGEIDLSNSEQLAATIVTVPNTSDGLVVDLTAVRYIDSTAVSLLHDLATRLRERGHRLVVACEPDSPPRRVLDLTAFHLTATLTDDLDAAIRSARQD